MIFPFLSQARFGDVDPGYFRDWIIVLCCLMGAIYLAANLLDKFKAKKPSSVVLTPDPLRTQKVPDLASRPELEEISHRIERDIEAVKEAAESAASKQEMQVIAIHTRINKVAESMEAVRGQLAEIAQNQRLLMEKFLK